MTDPKKDSISRALDILRLAPFSTAVNGFVLSSDTFYELVGILEGDAEGDQPHAEPEESKAAAKKRVTPKKRAT